MAERPRSPDTGDDTGRRHRPATTPPRWVKIFGIVALILVLLVVILHLTGNSPAGLHEVG